MFELGISLEDHHWRKQGSREPTVFQALANFRETLIRSVVTKTEHVKVGE